jgi:choline dehydrogenase
MGIDIVRDVPGVGANLRDHFSTACTYRISRNLSLNALHYSLPHRLAAAARYALSRSGPMSGTGLYVGALVRTDKRFDRPDMQLNISAWSTADRTADGVVTHRFPGISISPVHLAPEARGTVRLRSPDPLAPPEIRFNFLRNETDMRAMVAGVRFARSIARQHALQKLMVEETAPGVFVRTEEDIAADVRRRGVSNLHAVGTCAMGGDAMAVVDARLRVHGLDGLRVADASVMPVIVAGNTNAPVIMIAEKAADMIQEDAGEG